MIDNKTIEHARNADMISFFEKKYGFTFIHRGEVYRCRQHPSLVVKHDRRSWYWHSKGVGGYGVLDYLTKIENMPFREAVGAVSGMSVSPPLPQPESPPKTLILPERTGAPMRLYDYLCVRRNIDSAVVNALMQERKLYEDRRGNIVFVGFDNHGAPRFASLRGTRGNFRRDVAGSDKRYGFHMTFSESAALHIFESPIDAMSHASMADDWKAQNCLSLAGTSDAALSQYLKTHSTTKRLVFCLDNDPAGRDSAKSFAQKYAAKGFHTDVQLPKRKDFNEDLIARTTQIHLGRKSPERIL